jgi:hypothetical protein
MRPPEGVGSRLDLLPDAGGGDGCQLVLIQLFKIDFHDRILPSGTDTIATLFESVDNASNHFPLVDNEIHCEAAVGSSGGRP